MRSFKTILSAGFLASALVLAGCGGGSDGDTMSADEMAAMEVEKQKMEADMAISAAVDAAIDLDPTMATGEEVMAVEALISTANTEIMDLPEADRSAAMEMLAAAQNIVDTQNARLVAAAEAERLAQEKADADEMAAMEAEKKRMEDEAAKAKEMAVTAAKLYAAINPVMHMDSTNTAAVETDGSSVAFGSAATLEKGAMVAALGDWDGYSYMADDHEATVYAMMSDVMEGPPLSADTTNFNAETGEFAISNPSSVTANVAITSFTRTSGKQEFPLGDNMARVMLGGTYQGVAGDYYCAPTDANTKCSASVAAEGLTLGGGDWVFKPDDPDASTTETPGSVTYAFGWWLNESGDSAMATAFTQAPAATIDTSGLHGEATYKGVAAGKYALHGLGDNNDAGDFTAEANLTATFGGSTGHSIKGTINGFMGADGEARDWSIALGENVLAADGTVTATLDDGSTEGVNESMTTVWTIGGAAAPAAGSWDGSLHGSDDGGTPTHAVGTFGAGYNNVGKMVGAFGAELDD